MRLLKKALTFDDVLLVPAYSDVLPRDTSLTSWLTRNIELRMPLVSAAMDTVTESGLAIALAQEGGLGIVHKNLSPTAQAAEVSRVKRFESGVILDPITITFSTDAECAAPVAEGANDEAPAEESAAGPGWLLWVIIAAALAAIAAIVWTVLARRRSVA